MENSMKASNGNLDWLGSKPQEDDHGFDMQCTNMMRYVVFNNAPILQQLWTRPDGTGMWINVPVVNNDTPFCNTHGYNHN